MEMAGVPASAGDGLAFTGPEVALPSSFKVTAGAQALVGAFSAAVGHLATIRSPDNQPPGTRRIEVDSLETCIAFQSERHLRLGDAPKLWDELSGHYATVDGFIQFHTNFVHHRDALLKATGCGSSDDRSAVEAVVATAGRFELEQVVIDAGGIAAALRSMDEWNQHPHAAHIDGRPPLVSGRSGTSTGQPLPAAEPGRPLSGVKVLDMTRVIAGPVCSKALAAYGADVIRIGAPDLPVVDSILPDTTLGKRFAHCDITTTEGRETLLELVAEADVVVTGFRPGALAGYELDDEDLFEANPTLVIGSLNAFGSDGPWGDRRGFDSITQTATGIVASETEAFDSPKPRPLPCQFLDHGTGYLLALGVVGALARRHDGPAAQTIDASLLTTRNWLASFGRDHTGAGEQPDDETVARFLETRPSPFGELRHVGQPGRIEGTVPAWDRGPSKPGADQPRW
ncbi:MAG: CoA transferase [Acidimicrobiales bacterium]